MNWKKWDEDTWVNMSNGHKIEIQKTIDPNQLCVSFNDGLTHLAVKNFFTKAEAVAFIEELIK